MIHKFIFVNPKPGMSETQFFRYWEDRHAPIAAPIPQVKGYLICPRVGLPSEKKPAAFSGWAEVWIQDEAAEMAFLERYVAGPRLDEPNFLAFWNMLALDTTTHAALAGEPLRKGSTQVRLLVLCKRRAGMPLAEFRRHLLEVHAPKVLRLPGLRRCHQCPVNDGHYAIGEAPLDSVSLLWFDSVPAIVQMTESREYREQVAPDLEQFTEAKFTQVMAATEHWVVGPELR